MKKASPTNAGKALIFLLFEWWLWVGSKISANALISRQFLVQKAGDTPIDTPIRENSPKVASLYREELQSMDLSVRSTGV